MKRGGHKIKMSFFCSLDAGIPVLIDIKQKSERLLFMPSKCKY